MSPSSRLAAVASSLADSPQSGSTQIRTIQGPSEPLLDIRCELGESPLYEPETNTLHFVDIGRNEVHHLQLDTKRHTVDVYDEPVSCIRFWKDQPGFIAAVGGGFAILPASSPSSSQTLPARLLYHTRASNPAAQAPQMFNDGEVDPAGRFLAATKVRRGLLVTLEPREGTLFRIGGKGGLETVFGGLTIPNGMGWTKDGKTMYLTDTLIGTIWAFTYDAETGALADQRTFVCTKDDRRRGQGFPDGLAMDVDDCVWSAKFGGGRITRYRPDGTAELEIVFPTARNVTCIEFGGPDLTTLFVTTASLEESGDGGKAELVRQYTKDQLFSMGQKAFSAYEGSQQGQGHQGTGGGQFGVQGSEQLNSNDNNRPPQQLNIDHSQAVQQAAQSSGQDQGLFSQAMAAVQNHQNSGQAHNIDEGAIQDAHAQAYGNGNGSSLGADSMGAAAAMQALSMFTKGGGSSGGNPSQLIGMAMSEAAKLFENSGGAASGNKQDAVTSAGQAMMGMILKSQMSGMMGGGGGGGLGSMLSMASKLM